MPVEFEDVMKVRRLEKGASRLVRVDKDFFDQLTVFISKEITATSKSFSLAKARELENLKTAVVDVYNMREKKILAQALAASRTGNSDLEHMTTSEKELFDSIVELLTRSRGGVVSSFSDGGSDSAGDDFNK
ncbi:MAG: DNA replication complex GINS family protein, partial [Candidatus Diapherotrites archaeon]|nr:DNA replication complex GINS family protein [Candidatus Diapherotrites archaeon]